jgi:drug/metabolite transporter (DMT)-like permease
MTQTTATEARLDRWAVAAAATTMVLWGSAFVSIRDAAPHFSPGALALGRLVVGVLVLGLFWAVRRQGLPRKAAWPGIIASGILWFGLYMVALNWGEETVDAGTAALIIGVGPILIALVAGWLLKEGFSTRLLAGIAVSFAGAAVVGFAVSDGGSSSVTGVLLCLVAALGFAGGVICQKFALRHATPLQATTFGTGVAVLACLPFAGTLLQELSAAPLSGSLHIVYLGVFPTALAFTTWAYALSRIPAGKLSVSTYVVPAVAVVLSWTLLGEAPTWLSFVGGAMCLAGVAISRGKRKAPAPEPGEADDPTPISPPASPSGPPPLAAADR